MKCNDAMENQKGFKISQYACAVLLIVSSIALVAYQVSQKGQDTLGLSQILLTPLGHRLVDFLRHHDLTDQLLTGSTWLHISWNPFATPRHYIRIGYYK